MTDTGLTSKTGAPPGASTANDDATREPLDADERAFWLAFVRALIVVPRLLDADLMVGQRLSMIEYSVLMHLSEVPDRQLRMTELAGRCAVSLSGMTRIVSRLIADGYVRRVRSGEDARGAFAVLTDSGFERLEAAYPEHLASVRRHVIDHLDGFDLRKLSEAMSAFGSTAKCDPSDVAVQLSTDCPPPTLGATQLDADMAAEAAGDGSCGSTC